MLKPEQKLMITLIGWTLLSGGIYFAMIYAKILWGPMLYALIAGGLIIAFVVLNKGMKLEKPIEGDSESEKRYVRSKYLILLAFPLMLFVMLDLILLLFNLNIANLFKFD